MLVMLFNMWVGSMFGFLAAVMFRAHSAVNAEERWAEGYKLGVSAGKISGHATGYTEGKAIGYAKGFDDGYEDGVVEFCEGELEEVEVEVEDDDALN